MNKAEFLRHLEDLTESDQGSLSEERPLEDISGWDSVAFMGFIAFLDEKLGQNPTPDKIRACMNVGELMALAGIQDE